MKIFLSQSKLYLRYNKKRSYLKVLPSCGHIVPGSGSSSYNGCRAWEWRGRWGRSVMIGEFPLMKERYFLYIMFLINFPQSIIQENYSSVFIMFSLDRKILLLSEDCNFVKYDLYSFTKDVVVITRVCSNYIFGSSRLSIKGEELLTPSEMDFFNY